MRADYKDDIGYTRLQQEQGVNLPEGSGVRVAQAEAGSGSPYVYMPDVTDPQFVGKTITDQTGDNADGSFYSHANGVAKYFYGNSSSVAPAIDTINVYDATDWLNNGYLRANSNTAEPRILADRVMNHSWIGDSPDNSEDLEVVKKTDWVIDTDEFIHAIGVKNSTSTNAPMLSAAFNVIAVGCTDGEHGRYSPSLDSPYLSGRIRPELVAPFNYTSTSSPVVASAAALLVGIGHATPSLSTDPEETSRSNRAGSTIYNAERTEVIKAVLMAGANRVTDNTTNPDETTPKDITDYRTDPSNQSVNGLDIRFGAGQLNIYNSFTILAAGEQNSLEDYNAGGGAIGLSGFDYDPSFGGAGKGGGSNTAGSYRFSTGANPVMLTATLAWNVHIAEGGGGIFSPFLGAATLRDLDLRLYDETGGGSALVVESVSSIDNTENIWVGLGANRNYLLQVTPKSGQPPFEWDYSLAWLLTEMIDTDGDGLADSEEAAYGTDPLLADTDSDGLDDGVEISLGTDPLLADTDSDGFADGTETTYGSDPLLASDTPTENYVNNGDIDDNGVVNAADILLVTQMVLGELLPTPEQLVRADMVPDGVINTGDLLRIRQLALVQ